MDFLEKLIAAELAQGVQEDATRETGTPPIALTIAGSDSGGGAGAQADLKAFGACAVHGTSVLTLVTAQNTRGVDGVHMLPDHVVRAQFEAVVSDLPPAAAKTGALGTAHMIGLVNELLQEHPVERLVLDPVMVSKHGAPLMDTKAKRALQGQLMERAYVVTPNRFEAQELVGRDVEDLASMKEAARRIFDLGPRYVLIKGGHLDRIVRDLLYDGTGFVEFGADRVRSERLHGSGCTFSAVITARLAHGDAIEDAVDFARQFITDAIARAPALGHGVSPVHALHKLW